MVHIPIDEKSQSENTLKVLKLRKNELKNNLTKSLEISGFVFIILLYLKNLSFIRFGVRLGIHSLLSNPFPKDAQFHLTDNSKKQITKTLFNTALFINILFTTLDLIVGVPISSASPEDNPLNLTYGSLTLQIIGDSRPDSRLIYLYFNLLITVIQVCLLYLTLIINVNEEINQRNQYDPETMTYSLLQIEGDGYTGLSNVASINPIAIFNEIKNYTIDSNDLTNDYMGNRLNMFYGE